MGPAETIEKISKKFCTIRSFVRLLVRSKIFQILVRADAIDLLQTSSKNRPIEDFYYFYSGNRSAKSISDDDEYGVDFFFNSRSGRRDRFGPKIVKIKAILAIFQPFEVFGSGRPDAGTSGHPSVRTSERPSVEMSKHPMERPNVRVSGLHLERTQSTPNAEYWKTPL